MKPRLLIADDHPLILEGLRRILETRYAVVGSAENGRALVAAAERLRPDLVLLDIAMPLMNGIEATRHILKALPRTKVVVVSQHSERHYVRAAFQTGVSAFVLKQSAASDLLHAVEEVLRDRYYVSDPLIAGIPEALFDPRHNPGELFGGGLTPRQREVLQLIAEGKSTKEMADVLKISPKTVEFHRSSIMDELGLRTTAELTRYAVANGLITL